MRILLVDDFRMSNEIVGKELRDLGYEVDSTQSAESALSIMEKRHYDLIITDYVMPYKTGIDLLIDIRNTEKYKQSPVLILSAKNDSEAKERAFKEKATAWIKKPYSLDRLHGIIKKIERNEAFNKDE